MEATRRSRIDDRDAMGAGRLLLVPSVIISILYIRHLVALAGGGGGGNHVLEGGPSHAAAWVAPVGPFCLPGTGCLRARMCVVYVCVVC